MDLVCKPLPIKKFMACMMMVAAGCHPSTYRQEADTTATGLIDRYQVQALGRNEPFTIETPKQTLRRLLLEQQGLPVSGVASWGTDRLEEIAHWPEPGVLIQTKPETHPDEPTYALHPDKTLQLSLLQALTVAARHNRSYQDHKESVYTTALRLDLEADDFRNSYNGLMTDLFNVDNSTGKTVTENAFGAEVGVTRQLRSGAVLSGKLAVDLVKMLSSDGGSSAGLIADFSLTVPLLRGAGEHIVTEALTQAERDLIYAMWDFERFKRTFAVDVADAYLSVLQDMDRVENAANSYKSQITSARAGACQRPGVCRVSNWINPCRLN